MRTMMGKLQLAAATLGLLAGGTAFGQTLTMTDVNTTPGATNQSVQFNYTAGGNVSVIITNISLANAGGAVVGNTFQQFDFATSSFVACDGTQRLASAAPIIFVLCTNTGRYTFTSSAATTALPSFTNLARAAFTAGVAGTATYSYGPNCQAGEFPNAQNCTEFTNTTATRVAGTVSDTGDVTVAAAAVQRTLAFNPTFGGATINLTGGAGTTGTQTVAQTITVTSTGNAGTPTVTGCGFSGAGAGQFTVTPTSLSGFDTTPSQDLSVNCTRGAAAVTATLTCTETDADSAGVARTWQYSCPAGGVAAVNPTITAPPSGTISVPGGIIGSPSTTTLDFSASGGAGAGTATISCTSTGNVRIGNSGSGIPSGTTANQTVTGSAQPLDIIVAVTLTNAAQTPAGTIACTFTGTAPGATNYTVNAPAGVVQVAPEIIPANDLWSKLALFGLIASLGALVIGFRRQH